MFTLTQDQENVSNEIFKFLFSKDKYFILNGAGGTGKSTLIKHLITDTIPAFIESRELLGIPCQYSLDHILITATTNKACAALAQNIGMQVHTIHSMLGVVMTFNPKTGKQFLKLLQESTYTARQPHTIIFIDECSMIDSELWNYLDKYISADSKVIFIGDKHQLPPVNELISPIYTKNFQLGELKQTVRTDKKALKQLWEDYRKSIDTAIVPNIPLVPEIIEHISFQDMQPILEQSFKISNPHHLILSYTNQATEDFTTFINQDVRHNSFPVVSGGYYVNSSYAMSECGKTALSVEEIVYVKNISPAPHMLQVVTNDGHLIACQFRTAEITAHGTTKTYLVAEDANSFKWFLNKLAKTKSWLKYYKFKEGVVSLRLLECTTIHKAQGSTVDTVYINCEDLNRCFNLDVARRLLYVAISRARNKVVFFGNLNANLGRFI